MTDNEIIKALECCTNSFYNGFAKCEECPKFTEMSGCTIKLMCNALDLIKRQKAEIDILIRKKDSLRDEIAEQQAKIERLQKHNEMVLENCRIFNKGVEEATNKRFLEAIDVVKTEAIEEFADKYVTELVETYDLKWIQIDNLKKIADKVLKEMTEQ